MTAKITLNNQERNPSSLKKSQRANFVVMEIRNICPFDYDVQGIYTPGPPSSMRDPEKSNLR